MKITIDFTEKDKENIKKIDKEITGKDSDIIFGNSINEYKLGTVIVEENRLQVDFKPQFTEDLYELIIKSASIIRSVYSKLSFLLFDFFNKYQEDDINANKEILAKGLIYKIQYNNNVIKYYRNLEDVFTIIQSIVDSDEPWNILNITDIYNGRDITVQTILSSKFRQ